MDRRKWSGGCGVGLYNIAHLPLWGTAQSIPRIGVTSHKGTYTNCDVYVDTTQSWLMPGASTAGLPATPSLVAIWICVWCRSGGVDSMQAFWGIQPVANGSGYGPFGHMPTNLSLQNLGRCSPVSGVPQGSYVINSNQSRGEWGVDIAVVQLYSTVHLYDYPAINNLVVSSVAHGDEVL